MTVIPVENTSSRTALLDRVRGAFHPRTEPSPVVDLHEYRRRRPRAGVVELFVERVEEYEATVHVVTPDEVEETLAEVIGDRRSVVPRGFPWSVPQPVRDTWLDSTELAEVPVVATTVTLGVATTGTLVLTHGEGQGRRQLTTTPHTHVAVVLEDQVVFGVPDAIAALDPRLPQSWVSGPSAPESVCDLEEPSTCGPQRLEVVLVRAG